MPKFTFRKVVCSNLIILLASIFTIISILGCQPRKEPTAPKIKYLRVGSDTTYPPFEYLEEGKPVGFDIDLAREIAKRMGRQLKVVSTDWENLFSDLNQRKFDMAISALTISEERAKKVDFSDPYVIANQAILTLKDSEIRNEADLSGKIVGVEADTTAELTAENIPGIKRIKKYEKSEEAIKELETQSVDALISDYLIAANILKGKVDLKIASQIITDEKYGIAFRKGDKLKERVNRILAEIKKDGTYDRIYEDWFGRQK